MRVFELAQTLSVDSEELLVLLRQLGIRVADRRGSLSEADVARVIARVERERRAGHRKAGEAIQAVIEDSKAPSTRRRRRRAEPEPEPEEEPAVEAPAAEAEEAPAATAPAPEPAVEAPPAAEPEPEVEAPAAAEPEPEPELQPEPVQERPETPAAEPARPAAPPKATPRPAAAQAPAPEPVRRNAPKGPARVLRRPAPGQGAGAGSADRGAAASGGKVRIQAEGYTADGRRQSKDRKKGKRTRVDQDAVQSNIQRVMAELKGGGKKRKKGRTVQDARERREAEEAQKAEERAREARTVRVNEFLTVAELAELMDVSSTEIVGSAFKNLGLMVTVNQRLDFDQIELLLDEFGFKAVREAEYGTVDEEEEDEDPVESLRPRPPVVTVMGHVDHGKTRLLDAIRDTNVVAGEAGGITQHIGAYHVEIDGGRAITFLDTPGHAAFTAMRARGAEVTDIVVLVVAADDSVMPQTIEAISHARNAGVPLVVAVNKIDLPAANAAKVKQELLQQSVTVEDFGGDVLSAEISAKARIGIDDLLEKVLLQAELLDLQANPDREAQGTVIEAKLDPGKGPVATILIQRGTLRVGDPFVCGLYDGRVRALLDERGKPVEAVRPGFPIQVLGASGVPQAGDSFQAMEADRAIEIAQNRQRLEREKQLRIRERGFKLGDFSQLRAEGKGGRLALIIKGDVDGSVQAVADALEQLGTNEVSVDIVHRGVGAINESDVLLASTTQAIIIGFRVRPDAKSRAVAEREGVDVHTYDVIYEAVNDVRSALEGLLSPEEKERILGSAEVREVFKITRVGTIAGCYVTHGIIQRTGNVRLVRDGIMIYDGSISSLKRFKEDVREVRESFECGIGIANFNDIKVGDVIECYRVEEVARTLADSARGRD
ncbi:MAG: translation initiation factor IF-2 [Gemmatimonadota bacterium]